MQRFVRSVCLVVVLSAGWASRAQAQKALTWDEVRQRFEAQQSDPCAPGKSASMNRKRKRPRRIFAQIPS